MHGYYYDQNRVYPEEMGGPGGRKGRRPRRPGRAVLLFCAALALLIIAAVVLHWVGDTLRYRDALSRPSGGQQWEEDWEDPWQEEEKRGETTVERAPLGDEVTVTLNSQPQSEPHPLQTIYEENIQSIVSIWGDAGTSYSYGTGVVLSADGYIITNAHVIEGCSQVEVVLQDDRILDALLVGMDLPTDLAVLKVEGEDLQPAVFGDSDQLRVGDPAVAIGNPLGQELRGTMTDGIVSAINRDLNLSGRQMTLIQTNAALNSGNSGGPLINCYGQVIGINTMKMSSYSSTSATVEGLGFAIPITAAKPILDELIQQGYVSGRPAIGIQGETLGISTQLFFHMPSGVIITAVEETSDAAAKGLQPDDVIVGLNDSAIDSLEDLVAAKNDLSAGDQVTLTIYRGGRYYEVTVTLMDQISADLY